MEEKKGQDKLSFEIVNGVHYTIIDAINGKKYAKITSSNEKFTEVMKEKQSYFTSYLKKDNTFEPISASVETLPSGFYKPYYDSYNKKCCLIAKEVIMPNLYRLPNPVQGSIIEDIKKFWASEELYKKFGSVYKRNILLYSQPGNGKTSLINMICKTLIEEHKGIVIFIDDTNDMLAYPKIMERLRSVEPKRKVITVIEDFERLANSESYSALLLQLLDGSNQFDNVVTFATTNYPEVLEKRFTCRPSRFNIVIEYEKPNADIRRAYIEQKLNDGGIDINDEKVKNDIERYVRKTEGYTFDFVKEAIQCLYVDRLSEVETFDRLETLRKKDGKIKVSETEPKTIGFGGAVTSYLTKSAERLVELEAESSE